MSLLAPSSIAVVGASADEKKVGHMILANLLKGFKGRIVPVNPKGGEILGLPVSTSIAEISGNIDLVIIVTPAETVCGLLEECGKKKIRSAIVISAGFGESGLEGEAL